MTTARKVTLAPQPSSQLDRADTAHPSHIQLELSFAVSSALWQSGGRICGAILLAAIALAAHIDVRAQAAWAHQNGSLTPNGALVIKSLGGGSYNGTQNPVGAVAKGSQAAATQPATVVIQATSGGYTEIVPLFVVNTPTLPSCPTGYTALFSASSSTWGATPPTITNVAGSRYTLGAGYYTGNGQPYYGWLLDIVPVIQYSGNSLTLVTPNGFGAWSGTSQWAARLCSK